MINSPIDKNGFKITSLSYHEIDKHCQKPVAPQPPGQAFLGSDSVISTKTATDKSSINKMPLSDAKPKCAKDETPLEKFKRIFLTQQPSTCAPKKRNQTACQDFYGMVNSRSTSSDTLSSAGSEGHSAMEEVDETNKLLLERELVQLLNKDPNSDDIKSNIGQIKLRDLYRSMQNTAAIEKLGLKALSKELNEIDTIFIATTHSSTF